MTTSIVIIGLIFILLILFFYFYIRNAECENFQVAKNPATEYIPQNMPLSEFRTVNKWDYPGYLNFVPGNQNA